MKNISIIIGIALTAFVFTSCSKEDDQPAPVTSDNGGGGSTPTMGTVMMHYHSSWGMTDFHIDSTYVLASTIGGVPARQIKFSAAKMYVSKIAFDSDTNGTYLLVTPADMMYSIGNVNPGTYANLSFNVGLDATTNHADPITAPAPLNVMDMHWNWNTSAGYKFIKLEGQVDTSTTGMAGEWKSFTYHVATDAMLRNVSYTQSNTIVAGQTHTCNYHVMWNRFFDGVDIATSSSAHGGNATNTAIANNAQSVFMMMPS